MIVDLNPKNARVEARSDYAVRDLPLAIVGMINLLPEIGEPFTLRERLIWLRCMAGIFELAYETDRAADITIEARDP